MGRFLFFFDFHPEICGNYPVTLIRRICGREAIRARWLRRLLAQRRRYQSNQPLLLVRCHKRLAGSASPLSLSLSLARTKPDRAVSGGKKKHAHRTQVSAMPEALTHSATATDGTENIYLVGGFVGNDPGTALAHPSPAAHILVQHLFTPSSQAAARVTRIGTPSRRTSGTRCRTCPRASARPQQPFWTERYFTSSAAACAFRTVPCTHSTT